MSEYIAEVLNKLIMIFPAFMLGLCIATRGRRDE